jgi:hypothetical protein
MNGKSAVFGFIARLFGRAADLSDSASIRPAQAAAQQNVARQTRQMNAAGGGAMRGMQMSLPESGQGWNLSLQYNAARQRAPRGNGLIIEADPAKLCEAFRAQGIAAYERCFLNAQTSPPTGLGTGQSAIGAPFVRQPPVQGVNANMSFGITRNWSAQWSTQYDVERARFASQQIGLQRQLHDWNAVFTFSQTPSGNFAFNFFIALKAQPDLKFNYDRQTFRSSNF